MTRYTPEYLTEQLAPNPNMSLGGHLFYVNPSSITVTGSNQIYKNVTKGGIFFQGYTADVTVYQLTGTYSNAGLDEVNAAESYAPQFNRKIQAYPFSFPPLGYTNRLVYVWTYEISFQEGDPWYIHYQLQLQELPITQPVVPQPPTTVGSGLQIARTF